VLRDRLRWSSLLFLLATHCGPSRSTAPIFSTGTQLVDHSGRSVVLRGVNIRADGFFDPYHGELPLPPFTVEDCRVIGQDFGMNSLRLPINWSLLEPTQGGAIDRAYVQKVIQLSGDCLRQGVYTLVDLHQDAWSKYLGADGAPFWAHDPALPAADSDESKGNQATTSSAVQAAFAGFFADDTLLHDYANMAAQLARLIDGQPGIIGLELMNEPLGTPAQLATFYGIVAPAVRAAAPGLPIYFEPDALRNVVDFANPDPLTVADTVYAPHLYTGVFQGNWMIGDDARIDDSITNMLSEAAGAKAPVMVTELGNYPLDPVGAAWLTAAFAGLDAHALSASFWVYEEWPSTCGSPSCWGFYDEAPATDANGQVTYTRTLRPAAVSLVARGYPRAIAGQLDSFSYDATSRTLTVQMQGNGGLQLLSAPTAVYGGDVMVTCDGKVVKATRNGSQVEARCAGKLLVMSPSG
jgi:endoglycosylceramidase